MNIQTFGDDNSVLPYHSIARWLKKAFPDIFYLPWTEDHLLAIHDAYSVAYLSGHKRIELDRGTGATSIMLGLIANAISQCLASYILVVCKTQKVADALTFEMQRMLLRNVPNADAVLPVVLFVGERTSFSGLAVSVDGTFYRSDMVFIDNGVRNREHVIAQVRGVFSPGITPRIVEFATKGAR